MYLKMLAAIITRTETHRLTQLQVFKKIRHEYVSIPRKKAAAEATDVAISLCFYVFIALEKSSFPDFF